MEPCDPVPAVCPEASCQLAVRPDILDASSSARSAGAGGS